MNDLRAKSVTRMGGEWGGGTRRDSESGSTREVLPRAEISKSPTAKRKGSEMWEDKDWWVWRAIGCVMGEGGEMRGVERAKEGVGEVGPHNGGWVVGEGVERAEEGTWEGAGEVG